MHDIVSKSLQSSNALTDEDSRASWERLWVTRKRLHVYKNVVAEAKQCFGKLEGKRILEVGCGRGATLLELACLGADTVGLDYAPTAISTCEQLRDSLRPRGSAEFLLGDARKLPFESGSFDFVFSVGLIEHFESPEVLLAEQHRVLKPGGFLLVQVPQKFSPYTLIKIPLTKMGSWPYGGWETQFSPGELLRLLKRVGFDQSTLFGYGSFSLALLRHFLFPNLNYDAGSALWNRSSFAKALRAYWALDVGILAQRSTS